MYLSQDALDYVLSAKDELMDLERTLCAIPSPSHQEHRRAAFCKEWLEKAGAKGVYIDEVQNVIFPINAEGSSRLTLFAAHMDTVFPDTEPMPMREEDGILYCPGAGDDTGSVALVLMISKYLISRIPDGLQYLRGGGPERHHPCGGRLSGPAEGSLYDGRPV